MVQIHTPMLPVDFDERFNAAFQMSPYWGRPATSKQCWYTDVLYVPLPCPTRYPLNNKPCWAQIPNQCMHQQLREFIPK